jgi:peptide deformylase
MLNILTYPNEKLKQTSIEVTPAEMKDWSLQIFIDEMIETMKQAKGIGLAAPQVGKNIRIIIATKDDGEIYALINPEIIKKSFSKVKSEEGCLSIPGKIGIVKRYKTIEVKALDRLGKEIKIKANGLFSIVLQHEIDHLDGVLFIDKAERIFETKDIL